MRKNIRKLVRQAGKTFYWGISTLPKAQREASYTIYAFSMHIQNIAYDNQMSLEEKEDIFNTWLEEFYFIYDKKAPITDIGRRIYKNCMRFKLPKTEFMRVIEGARAEAHTDDKPFSMEEYLQYCRNTSGASTNFTLRIMGIVDEDLIENLSTYLGIAFETTTILKNVKEDAMDNQIFIPKEILDEFQIDEKTPFKKIAHKNLYMAREKLAKIAKENYEKAYDIINSFDKNTNSRIVKIAYNSYKQYFDSMEKRGWEIVSPKAKVNPVKKIFIILKGYIGKLIN